MQPSPTGTPHCPRCGTALAQVKRGELMLDTCDTCHGVWLDRGEIERLLRAASGAPGLGSLQALLAQPPGNGSAPHPNCPRCGAGMHGVSFSAENAKVQADRCASCGGLWLDAGELGSIGVL